MKEHGKKMKRVFKAAGKHEELEELELEEWLENSTLMDRFNYPIYFHLINHGVDPAKFRFKRVFRRAFKRKDESDV